MKQSQNRKRLNLINMNQAGYLLGYQNGTIIRDLIKQGHLKKYRIPDSRRIMVEQDEVKALIRPAQKESTE
jgi:hypothetical protein